MQLKSYRIVLLLIVCILGSVLAFSQSENAWKTLSKVAYKKEYNEMLGFKVDVPVFSEEIRKLEGQTIMIRGYVIPTEGFKSHQEFVFSAFPYATCFFCGGAGPETVMEVEAVKPVKFTSDPIVLKGKLHLNASDLNRLMYRMTDVVQLDDDAMH